MTKFAIACGGTGGHLAPGIAVAEALINDGHDCALLISNKSIDKLVIKKYPQLKYEVLLARPFLKTFSGILKFFTSQVHSILMCFNLLRKSNFDVVVGFGGFTNVPVVIAAFLLRKPVILHESNRIIGKSIRLLAWMAKVVFLPKDVHFDDPRLQKKEISAGMPLRREIMRVQPLDARAMFGLNPNSRVVTILGGSQGAHSLTRWAHENFQQINSHDISIVCVCGPNNYDMCKQNNVGSGCVKNVWLPFCDDMSNLLSATDLLVCRAGAGTIAEAEYFSLPMILVPYPKAADNHQEANAQYAKKHGAMVVHEEDMCMLHGLIVNFFSNKSDMITHFSDESHECMESETNRIVEIIEQIAKK